MKQLRLAAAAAGAALALVALSACTSTPNPTATTGKPSSMSAGAAALPTVPTGKGIIKAANLTSCDTTGSNVTAKGTVTMPEGEHGDVAISVSWVNGKTSTAYSRGVTTVKSPQPGKSTEWQTTGTLPAGAESVSCVLGAVIPK